MHIGRQYKLRIMLGEATDLKPVEAKSNVLF